MFSCVFSMSPEINEMDSPAEHGAALLQILGELWFQHVSTVHFPVSPVLFIKFVATKIQLASMKSTFLVG